MVHIVDGLHHAFPLEVDFLCAYDTVLRISKEILCVFQMIRVNLMYVSFQQKMGMLGQSVLLQFLRDAK